MNDLPGYPSRRGFLKATAAGAALMGAPLAARSQNVPGQNAPNQTQPGQTPAQILAGYAPQYFTPEEWQFVLAATARLIPAEGTGPGAHDTLVPIFIDRQMVDYYGRAEIWYMQGPHDPTAAADRGWQTPLTPADLYRRGITAFNAACEAQYGGVFAGLDPATQDAALTALQNGDIALQPELSLFFTTLLANTKEGYFSDPIHGGNHGMKAWVHIGFPGARAAFRDWPSRHNVKYPLGPVSISGERA